MKDLTGYIMSREQLPENGITVRDPMPELVLQRVRLYARKRIGWLRKIWQETADNSSNNAEFTYHTEVDGYLSNADTPAAESAWQASEPLVQVWEQALTDVEVAMATQPSSRLNMLADICCLTTAEMDVLQACLAIAIEPNLGRVYAYLQDHSARGYVTMELVARLFGHGRCLPLSAASPLKVWGLIIERETGRGEPPLLECDAFIKNWLLGLDALDETLTGIARLQPYQAPLSAWPVKETIQFIDNITGTAQPVRIIIAGAEGSGRRSFAACVCRQLGLELLTIDAGRIPESSWQQVFMYAQRQAFLDGYALAWYGSVMQERYWPPHIPVCSIQFVIAEVDEFLQPAENMVDHRIELPPVLPDECKLLWLRLIPAAATWPQQELTDMIHRRRSTIGQIVTVAAKNVNSVAAASEELNASFRGRLGNLAQHVSGSFDWNDLVVPPWLQHNLEDFTFEAGERVLLWERPEVQRLFPRGKGLVALFTGSPGTGKTMAAQVVATALQLDLFRIDLSSIVSKYIGETSKNIERILNRAERMDVVLLFDEADALFGKRTDIKDAHDRFANTDTNYLLQAIEQYPGIAILATNKKANIDTGFTRRLRYVLEFPKPDVQMRLQLWRKLIAALAGTAHAALLDKDLENLAEALEITGAQIKSAILSAMFIARRENTPVTMQHLLRGIERELIKEGRGLGKQVNDFLKR
ncbi:ATP-binding protein [Chitinophaga sp. CF418]|uniref:ATP-binding protein n=1 Tax=Chitinophaga sp. CF418 TaxID=1855287 RepID=UPI0009141ECC|nr:ATP-binding protein [Chitinophaga sp. CF418]SHN40839.1 ATPase family associated with various cellular activities (AAA) [Chitinophaga sp. CF418]